MQYLLKGGTLVSPNGSETADLLIENEKIAAIGENLPVNGAEIVDVRGKLIFPGFIDAHTHFDLDVSNTTTADDFRSGTQSAVLGGTTTVIDYACPNKGQTLWDGLSLWHEKADGKCACDYGFHMTVDDWNDTIKEQIGQMFGEGISSFKMYMTYPAMMIGDRDLYRALLEIKKYGGIAGVHCENSGVIDALIAQHQKDGKTEPSSHPQCRPSALEAEAVGRLLRIAQVADVPVVIVHLSAQQSLQEVAAARARGQKVYVETCPQYLLLDESRYLREYTEAAGCICAPPLRQKQDQNALWAALADGTVQTVCTDHCSFTHGQKDAGRGDFTKIPGGVPGVETRGLLLYTYGVKAGKITKEKMCELLCENPAKLYGIYPQKGTLSVGSDADLVVLDPEQEGVFSEKTQHSAAGYTPYENMKCSGRIERVYLRGTLTVSDGKLLESAGGKYLHRGVGSL